ncbi:DUF86 domain-containing protein [Saccharicrinis sp. FJH62]|uniref:HepT-like ribonuclease domain-containing protein n=1 Tax=Saccharicrinis sp. FJH62 TaxID=3344657 RepID=UPI0035D5278C
MEAYSLKFRDADEFNAQNLEFDATMMNFVVIGEMVSKLSDKFIEAHAQLEWHNIKSFRNIAAHNYFGIDAEEVWQIIHNKIPDLKNYIKSTI